MIIKTKTNPNIGISIIKKNNKISCHLCSIDSNGKVKELINSDNEFPFANPLICSSALKMFEFIIEANNFASRIKVQN